MGEGRNRQTDTHFITIHQSGLGAGPSEKKRHIFCLLYIYINIFNKSVLR